MIASCWKSFWPNTARCGRTAPKSFVTTVVTPRKWPGRCAPSSTSAQLARFHVGLEARRVHRRSGRCVDRVDARAAGTLRGRRRSGAGTRSKSSRTSNCSGLTKIDTTTTSARRRASSTSARCPACSAPIVGTNPTTRPASRCASDQARIAAGVSNTCMSTPPRSPPCRCASAAAAVGVSGRNVPRPAMPGSSPRRRRWPWRRRSRRRVVRTAW